jgi:hypothetical protein
MVSVTWVKFECFIDQLGKATHDLNGDTLMVALSNSAPNAATHLTVGGGGGTQLAVITEEHGYAATDIQNTYSQTSGVGTMVATDVVFTATGGTFGPWRYVVVYNSSKSDKLIGYGDYGTSVTTASGDVVTIDFPASWITINSP